MDNGYAMVIGNAMVGIVYHVCIGYITTNYRQRSEKPPEMNLMQSMHHG